MEPEKYILVDFENIQPADLDKVRDQGFKIRIFLGSLQERLPLALVSSLQVFGPALEYVQTCGRGSNALDFYIAYFLGRKSFEQPHARFFIVSQDTGFDPLLRHLRSQGIFCRRVVSTAEIRKEQALIDAMRALPLEQMMQRVMKHLSKPSLVRPRSLRTLRTSVSALFGKKLRASQIDDVIFELKRSGFVVQDSPRIIYQIDPDVKPPASEAASGTGTTVASGPNVLHIAGLMN